MIDKPVINTDLKKCDKAYVVEDDILWEVFGDGYSQAEVIWDKENICELLNNLHQENEQLRLELETHKHPLWSTREAERKLSEVTNNLANEVKKNGLLNEEINQLRIENMRLKKKCGD